MACSMADSAVPALAPSGPAACTARLTSVEGDHRSPGHAEHARGPGG